MEYNRTKISLLGLAVGDALSWQAMFNRSFQYPVWTRRVRREIDADSEKNNILKLNLPFSLNNQPDLFNLSPTDDTEWAAFTARIIAKDKGEYIYESHLEGWKKLASDISEVKGSVAVIGALKNIKKGLNPPASGNDQPHFFDDSAMVRASVIGSVYCKKISDAVDFISADASITNSLDGVWAAKAFGAAISSACAGNDIDFVIHSALEQIPNQSWLHLKVKEALNITSNSNSLFQALPLLHDIIIDHSYNYGSSAPDNLALSLAIFSLSGGKLFPGISSAACLSKTADSVPAFVGALCGACSAEELPATWYKSLSSLRGICIPSLKGTNYLELADVLNSFTIDN